MILCLIFIFLTIGITNASHYRGGSLTAKPLNDYGSVIEVEYTLSLSWRRDSAGCWCDQTTINNNGTFGPGGEKIMCDINCKTPYEIIGPADVICTAFAPPPENWSYGSKILKFNVTANVRFYEAIHNGSAWMSYLEVGKDTKWMLRSKIDTTKRPDTGTINTTPITLMPPVVILRSNFIHQIQIPTTDADVTDDVRCRWSTSAMNECGGICNAVPPANLTSGCLLTFNGFNATNSRVGMTPTGGWYAPAITIEDFKTTSDTQAMSAVPLQFLILVEFINSSCMTPPEIIGDRPQGSCIAAPLGEIFSQRMVAKVGCTGVTITKIQVLGPTGIRYGSTTVLSGTTDTWYVNLTWTPSASQYGPNVICGLASDSTYLVSSLNCFTVLAGIPYPALLPGTGSPSGILSASTLAGNNGVITWSVKFNMPVIRPVKASFIRIYYSNGTLWVQMDASIFPTVNYYNDTLTFQTGNSFAPGSYYILFGYGAGLGSQYCKPESDAIKDPTFWTFTIQATTTIITSTATTPAGGTVGTSGMSSTVSWILPVGVQPNTTTASGAPIPTTTTTITTTTTTTVTSTTTSTTTIPTTTTPIIVASGRVYANCSSSVASVNTTECNIKSMATIMSTFLASTIGGHVVSFSSMLYYLYTQKKAVPLGD